MFYIGKKGTDKSQDAAREAQRSSAAPQPEPAKRAPVQGGSREAAVIGPSIHIDGDLRGEEDLLIEGEVNGTVQLKNNSLTIGSQGKIRADVYAHSVYVEGYMEGDIYGSERVSVRKSAQVRGNITSPRVSLEDGARFKGSIEMDPQAVEAALGSRRGASAATPAATQTASIDNSAKPAAGAYKPGGENPGAAAKRG
jgi:cytoskeletal protein CcmA (bactofilin family)